MPSTESIIARWQRPCKSQADQLLASTIFSIDALCLIMSVCDHSEHTIYIKNNYFSNLTTGPVCQIPCNYLLKNGLHVSKCLVYFYYWTRIASNDVYFEFHFKMSVATQMLLKDSVINVNIKIKNVTSYKKMLKIWYKKKKHESEAKLHITCTERLHRWVSYQRTRPNWMPPYQRWNSLLNGCEIREFHLEIVFE